MGTKEYTSNLINDEELAKKFNAEALMAARALRTKYYTLFQFMTEEDIVMECWDKIMRQDIGFDESKKCKFSSFVKMMVNNRCIDMCRKIKKHEGVLSLDAPYTSDSGDTSSLSDYVMDSKSSHDIDAVELTSVLESLSCDMNAVPVNDIIILLGEGYNMKEISEMHGINSADVRAVKRDMKNTVLRRCSGSTETLADILYGNEETLSQREDEIICVLSYVKDDKGIKLSDIVKKVIEGYTYDGIGKSLGVSGGYVKSFLDKFSSIVV